MKRASLIHISLGIFLMSLPTLAASVDLNAVAKSAHEIAVSSGAHEITAELTNQNDVKSGARPEVEVGFYSSDNVSEVVYDSSSKLVDIEPLPTGSHLIDQKEAISKITALVAMNPAISNIDVRQTGWAQCADKWVGHSCYPVGVYQIEMTYTGFLGIKTSVTQSIPDSSYRVPVP